MLRQKPACCNARTRRTRLLFSSKMLQQLTQQLLTPLTFGGGEHKGVLLRGGLGALDDCVVPSTAGGIQSLGKAGAVAAIGGGDLAGAACRRGRE